MTVTSDFPRFAPGVTPTLQTLSLTDEQRNAISRLQSNAIRDRWLMMLTDAYYRAEQIITSLGIAVPPQLQHLRVVPGWAAVAVDPLVERLSVDSFRLPGQTDADSDLMALWTENGMAGEQNMAYIDALSMGRSWLTVGTSYEADGPAVICVESPLNMFVGYDTRSREPKIALQQFWMDGIARAAFYEPGVTTQLAQNDKFEWEVVDHDPHGQGIPIVRMANRPRSHCRDGQSEITPALRSLIDQGCRTLMNLAIASELYSVPQKYILGAIESDFQSADGTAKTAWETTITKILGLEDSDDRERPTVGQFQVYDPSVYTKVLDKLAADVAGMIGATPQDLGLYTTGNPPSADAVEFAEGRRNRKAENKQDEFGRPLVEAMQLAMRFQRGGELPADMRRMEIDWRSVSTPQPAATAVRAQLLVHEGIIPPTSDVTLKELGYSPVDRARLAQDRDAARGDADIRAITEAVAKLPAKAAPDAGPIVNGA